MFTLQLLGNTFLQWSLSWQSLCSINENGTERLFLDSHIDTFLWYLMCFYFSAKSWNRKKSLDLSEDELPKQMTLHSMQRQLKDDVLSSLTSFQPNIILQSCLFSTHTFTVSHSELVCFSSLVSVRLSFTSLGEEKSVWMSSNLFPIKSSGRDWTNWERKHSSGEKFRFFPHEGLNRHNRETFVRRHVAANKSADEGLIFACICCSELVCDQPIWRVPADTHIVSPKIVNSKKAQYLLLVMPIQGSSPRERHKVDSSVFTSA